MRQESALVVFSHLRWDFVYQRPQHLMSRLAARRRVCVVEEPLAHDAAEPAWERTTSSDNLSVYRLRTPVPTLGFHDDHLPAFARMLPILRDEENLGDCILWFYTPMALPLARAFQPRAVVYDCVDELSAFLGAPPELLNREAELLRRADLVFTGGPSLYRAKKHQHPNTYCFPSSVDAAHFGQARRPME